MVKYYDDAGVYDAPVDKVWKVLEAHTDENLPKMHPSIHSARTLSEKEGTSEREVEYEVSDGKTEKARLRMTVKPPYSMGIDYLSGSMEGSWVVNTYVPEGDKTRVICTGDFHIRGTDDETALEMGREMIDSRFEEDLKYLHEHW